jgi:hypothetical protein
MHYYFNYITTTTVTLCALCAFCTVLCNFTMNGYALPEMLGNVRSFLSAAKNGNTYISPECKARFERAAIIAYQNRNANNFYYDALLVHFGRPWSYWKNTREISEFLVNITMFMDSADI